MERGESAKFKVPLKREMEYFACELLLVIVIDCLKTVLLGSGNMYIIYYYYF